MILQRKALIDFRNWLLSEYNLRWHEFDDMPVCGKMGYYLEYFTPKHFERLHGVIKISGNKYNERHEQDK